MAKYNIDKSFGMTAKFTPPLNRGVVFAAQAILKNSVKCLRHRDNIDIKTEKICVQNGTIDIDIITPRDCSRRSSCLFYIHGGGFAYEAQPHQYKNAADYAVKTNSIVVFPRYRLTPKVSAPTLLDDCVAAWKWMLVNADKYKIDPEQIGIGGDSAGGYLAAKLTNLISKSKGNLQYQMLIYPVIDSATRTESMTKYTDTPMWNAKNNRIMWKWYYGSGEWENSLLDDELPCVIPPTYIETAEFDCLHDEGLLYADKLKKAGVNVTVYETHGTMHGFDCVECETTQRAVLARTQFIHRQIDSCR